ncbi:MAG TPA: alginate lyase family protein [Bryobacteraceae bacterium]|nr:alginate lyase family protein [Bryobacteraceae bacterium]
MRSPAEIAFRLRQELANAALAVARPRTGELNIPSPLPGLPDPHAVASRLRGTAYAKQVAEIAQQILRRQVPALGLTLSIGDEIHWRRDHVIGIETPLSYFRRIPYLDPARAGDHKVIWELNRHQHLVLLAQAHLLDPRPEYPVEIQEQLESWMDANPFQRGINWTSALEVAFRALSWVWLYHFTGRHWTVEFRRRFLSALNQHGLHLEYNLSVYFSPNTHLLGEALALYTLGRLMPQLPRSRRWEQTGARWVGHEMHRQVFQDGGHFEQSAYYHVYATDMFLFFAMLANPDQDYLQRLERMAGYLHHLMGPSRILPLLGDDDGGRLYHPYGARSEFGRGTLAACGYFLGRPGYIAEREDSFPISAWWFGAGVFDIPPAPREPLLSKLFPQTGVAVLFHGDHQVLLDAGEFGAGTAGHSHSDTLSLMIRRGGEEILLDPGTYTYVGDLTWRNRFRGSAFHNTVSVNGLDQAIPAHPFSWQGRPAVSLISFKPTEVQADCSYAQYRHQRTVNFESGERVVVSDEISGPPGKHMISWFWHFGIPAVEARKIIQMDPRLTVSWEEGGLYGWRSPALGVRLPAPVVHAQIEAELPLRCQTVFHL